VFDMYMDHMGAEAVRTEFVAPRVSYTRNGQPATFLGLAGSASRKDKTLTLTVVNPSADQPRETEIAIGGARVTSAAARTLTTPKLDSHNTFEAPDAVPSPAEKPVTIGAPFVFTFPPASVTKLKLTIA